MQWLAHYHYWIQYQLKAIWYQFQSSIIASWFFLPCLNSQQFRTQLFVHRKFSTIWNNRVVTVSIQWDILAVGNYWMVTVFVNWNVFTITDNGMVKVIIHRNLFAIWNYWMVTVHIHRKLFAIWNYRMDHHKDHWLILHACFSIRVLWPTWITKTSPSTSLTRLLFLRIH